MKAEKLSDIKKELQQLNKDQVTELCLRLIKYKKENKELLSYLLYNADDPLAYAESVKTELMEEFHTLKRYEYYSAKQLRKILKAMSKHAKYTASVEVDLDLTLWFCKNYLIYVDLRSHYKPLQTIFLRQIEKAKKLFPKLHEDLQFDYSHEYNSIIEEADMKAKWFTKKLYE